jgi:hypothetical protein
LGFAVADHFLKAGRLVHELQWRGTNVSLAPEACCVEGLFSRPLQTKKYAACIFPDAERIFAAQKTIGTAP